MLHYFRPPGRRLFSRAYYKRLLATAPSSYWPLWDNAGKSAQGLVLSPATANLLANPDLELTGPFTTFSAWRDRAGTGTIAIEGDLVHGGAAALKLTRGADDSLWIYQDIKVVPGDTPTLSLWTRGDGTVAGRYCIYDLIGGTWIVPFTTTGVTAATYAQVTHTPLPTIPAGCTLARVYLAGPTAAGSVYFDDITLTAAATLHGSYSPTNVTLAQPGIGDGRHSASFTGSATSVLIGCPRFSARWNGNLGSAITWGRMSAGQWADTAEHRYLFHAKSAPDAHFYVVFGKNEAAQTLFWRRKAGVGKSTNEQTHAFDPTGPLTWFCMGFTWDTTTPRLRGYLYVPGSLPFTEIFTVAGTDMETWTLASHPVDDYNTCLMAGAIDAQEFAGLGAHACYWGGRALSKGEMQHVMVL